MEKVWDLRKNTLKVLTFSEWKAQETLLSQTSRAGEGFLGHVFIQVQIEIGWLWHLGGVFMGGHEEGQGEGK